MSFLSLAYAVFLPVVFAVHWAVPARMRWATVLLASLWFYGWAAPSALPMLLAATLLSWGAALWVSRCPQSRAAKAGVLLAAAALVALLLFFKWPRTTGSLIAPLGLSFYTFQTLSYLFDVRKGRVPAERHPGRYAAFVLFFPKLLSGPIERAGHLLPQLAVPPTFSAERAEKGLRQMALGLVRKVVVADCLATFTDPLFGNPAGFNGAALWFGAILYAVQIYCDFAGYSDLAIGSARVLGYDLCDNFRAPVFATSLKDFWSRWHISLSTWFRDYLYIPLGGSRRGAWRTRIHLLATFVVSGLWHGMAPTFLAWGALHGAAQVVEKDVGRWLGGRVRAPTVVRWALTAVFVTVAWVFFRAPDMAAARTYLAGMAGAWRSPLYGVALAIDRLAITPAVAARLFLPTACVLVWDAVSLRCDPFERTARWPALARWILHAATVAMILYVLLPLGESSRDFIYFRF